MDKDAESAFKWCFCIVVNTALTPVYIAAWGLAYQCHWNWFVVPAFDVRPMPFALSCGLMLCVALVKSRVSTSDDDATPEKLLGRSIGYNLFVPAFSLAAAFAVSLFV